MGFSPGEFQTMDTSEYHFESGPFRVRLWNHDESKIILDLPIPEARKAADHLLLLVEMAEQEAEERGKSK